jgi:SAM-dependent methyltransferase
MLERAAVEQWDAIWLSRGESDHERTYSAILVRHGALHPGQWAVEAGSGSGRALCKACQVTGARPLALDISMEAIRTSMPMLRRLGGSAVIGDVRQLPFRSGAIPTIFNSGVIEHFRLPHDRDALAEMARVTENNGTVLVLVPNRWCAWFMLAKMILRVTGKWRYGYERSYTPSGLSALGRNIGLKLSRRVGSQVLPPARDGFRTYCGPRLAAWLVRAERRLQWLAPYVGMATGVVFRRSSRANA